MRASENNPNFNIMALPELEIKTAMARSHHLNFVGGIQCVIDSPVPVSW